MDSPPRWNGVKTHLYYPRRKRPMDNYVYISSESDNTKQTSTVNAGCVYSAVAINRGITHPYSYRAALRLGQHYAVCNKCWLFL